MKKNNKQNKSTKFINLANPLVNVIIPVYNRFPFLIETLKSMKAQTYQNWSAIIVNDAGEDCQHILDQFNEPRFKYYQHSVNQDLAQTRNTALKYVDGDYISLLDSDDLYLPLTIEFRMWQTKKLHADVVYSRSLQSIMEREGDYYKVVHKQLYWDSPFDRDLILVQNVAPCCNVQFSRKAWEKTGYNQFDTTLHTSEDWAFWVELSRVADFHELKLVDTECSWRNDGSQMTGTRTGFTDHLPYLYGKWRKYATNLPWVIEHQNASLKARNLNPADYDL